MDTSDFKALTKLDALQSLQKELNKLLLIAPQNEIEVRSIFYLQLNTTIRFFVFWNEKSIKTDFNGFEKLFKRYLTDVNAEIKWQKIEPLPSESVGCFLNNAHLEIRFEF